MSTELLMQLLPIANYVILAASFSTVLYFGIQKNVLLKVMVAVASIALMGVSLHITVLSVGVALGYAVLIPALGLLICSALSAVLFPVAVLTSSRILPPSRRIPYIFLNLVAVLMVTVIVAGIRGVTLQNDRARSVVSSYQPAEKGEVVRGHDQTESLSELESVMQRNQQKLWFTPLVPSYLPGEFNESAELRYEHIDFKKRGTRMNQLEMQFKTESGEKLTISEWIYSSDLTKQPSFEPLDAKKLCQAVVQICKEISVINSSSLVLAEEGGPDYIRSRTMYLYTQGPLLVRVILNTDAGNNEAEVIRIIQNLRSAK